MGRVVYGNYGGTYLKTFELIGNTLYFDCTDLNFNSVVNPHLDEVKLDEFLKGVLHFNRCGTQSANDNLINLEKNILHKGAFGDENLMYENTSIIGISVKDDYCLGVSLEKGDNRQHDFMVVYKIFEDSLGELKTGGEHDELTVYKSYKDGKVKVIYLSREECLSIVSNCRLQLQQK